MNFVRTRLSAIRRHWVIAGIAPTSWAVPWHIEEARGTGIPARAPSATAGDGPAGIGRSPVYPEVPSPYERIP